MTPLWIRLAISFRDLVLLMDAPLRRCPFSVAGPPNLLSGCGPAAHAHSREFGAMFSLFVRGENHVSVIDPARKKEVGCVRDRKTVRLPDRAGVHLPFGGRRMLGGACTRKGGGGSSPLDRTTYRVISIFHWNSIAYRGCQFRHDRELQNSFKLAPTPTSS